MTLLDRSRKLGLQTVKGNDIPNTQDLEVDATKLANAAGMFKDEVVRRWGSPALKQMIERRPPTATYNCHGMTFASRRTGVYEDEAVQLILDDDGYTPIMKSQVLPGDIVLYYDRGVLQHSGTVVRVETVASSRFPTIFVISKMAIAGEYIHREDIVPYETSDIRYFREA